MLPVSVKSGLAVDDWNNSHVGRNRTWPPWRLWEFKCRVGMVEPATPTSTDEWMVISESPLCWHSLVQHGTLRMFHPRRALWESGITFGPPIFLKWLKYYLDFRKCPHTLSKNLFCVHPTATFQMVFVVSCCWKNEENDVGISTPFYRACIISHHLTSTKEKNSTQDRQKLYALRV